MPSANSSVTLTAGATNTLNFAVTNAEPPFRITSIRLPSSSSGSFSWAPSPASISPGQSNYFTGVVGATIPSNNATLTITGDGLTLGSPTFLTNAFASGDSFMSIRISVASNATPGLRSFVLTQGTNVAYANGFIEVLPVA
ncbi:MAG TPA: hypothetical protein VLT36_25765 [Candidatus Dormibacteraeota bacterium]|nr:hypothetical protein [Candidatus Dormibacteraeota bacterium]